MGEQGSEGVTDAHGKSEKSHWSDVNFMSCACALCAGDVKIKAAQVRERRDEAKLLHSCIFVHSTLGKLEVSE